jgi:hypothetical protein
MATVVEGLDDARLGLQFSSSLLYQQLEEESQSIKPTDLRAIGYSILTWHRIFVHPVPGGERGKGSRHGL